MNKVVIVSFHNYVPMHDHKYFNVILDYFLHNYRKYWSDEVDKLYLLDSNWDIKVDDPKIEVIKTDPNLRYYDAYKKVLPDIDADYVMFMDNDMVVYREGMVKRVFNDLHSFIDVVSIFDTIGTYKTDKMNGKNKFCPYWFATGKYYLQRYLDVDWGSNMPESETLGKLTEAMLNDEARVKEWKEDKTSLLFSDIMNYDKKGKNLGYYHIRAGSVPAFLLTHKHYGNKQTYEDYIKNQPKTEILRQIMWYFQMAKTTSNDLGLAEDMAEMVFELGLDGPSWRKYDLAFQKFHGL